MKSSGASGKEDHRIWVTQNGSHVHED
jgi:hypothetical protein